MIYPNIDPVAFSLGPIAIRWYGVLHLIGFILAFWLAINRSKKLTPPWSFEKTADLLFYCVIGIIFGGTMGYFIFYDPQRVLHDPLVLLRFWEPGRSFHGGFIGVAIALFFFHRKYKTPVKVLADFVSPLTPIGIACGRLGNFLNGELWGHVTTLPIGMVFPEAGPLPRHPSQLYEFFLEGVLLFIIVNVYARHPRPTGAVTGVFLIFYGIFRIFSEFFRVPDTHIGYLAFQWLTIGQVLSLPMIIIGIYLLCVAKKLSPLSNSGAVSCSNI